MSWFMRLCLFAALMFVSYAVGHSAELPRDMWSGKYGGFPSLTAGPGGVSVTIPTRALAGAGPEEMTAIVKALVEQTGPGMCSDVFDFGAPHPDMHVAVGIEVQPYAHVPYFEVAEGEQIVTFDYKPARAAKCVNPEEPMS